MLAGIQFSHIVDFMIMMPLGPQITQQFGIGDAAFGFLVSSYTWAAAISGLVASAYVDRFDRKRLLLALFVAFAVATLGCAVAWSYASLVAARIATGLFGGVLSALVLGSAVSPLTSEVREAFRAAGLSHALAASGYHLTVLLGAVMLVARGLMAPLRWALALGAMAGFLLLAGPQPSVVRAVLMGAVAFALQESGRCSRPLAVMLLCLLQTRLLLLLSPQKKPLVLPLTAH